MASEDQYIIEINSAHVIVSVLDPLLNLFTTAFGRFPPAPPPGQNLVGFILKNKVHGNQSIEVLLSNLNKTSLDIGVVEQLVYCFVWSYLGGQHHE